MHTEYLLEKELSYEDISADCEIKDGDIFIDGAHIGSFQILPYSDGTVYFHSFVIDRPGLGYGTRVFPQILNHLGKDYKKIRLQVSSENTAAMKLYKDFKIVEQVTV